MTVIVLECVPVGLRGQLTRWLLEVRAGVFVGTVSSRVRECLWEMVEAERRNGSAVMIHGAQNEQGFVVRASGDNTREIVDIDGLALVRFRMSEASR